MLEVRHLNAAYGQHPALQDASLTVDKGEIVVILGANGAGKSTLLRAIAGICEGEVSGEITFSGRSLSGLSADQIVESGVSLVPEGRGIFADLTVKENLLLGAYSARARSSEKENLEQVISLFPKLGERQNQVARTMSGGEQQMVAIGRAMMSAPDILMLDEPSLGLAPLLCKELFQNLKRVKQLQIGILLVEQNAKQSLAIADRGYLLENTRITHEDSAANLATDPAVQEAYLGGSLSSVAVKGSNSEPGSEPTTPQAPLSSATTTSVGEIRRSADQQIGISIDDMVAKAVQTSAAGAVDSAPGQSLGSSTINSNIAGQANSSGKKVASVAAKAVVSNSQIERMTLDIEKAAQDARKRVVSRTTERGLSQQRPQQRARQIGSAAGSNTVSGVHVTDTGVTQEDSRPRVIEVYKRPRVEVYRRRSGGEFERD